MKNLQSTSLARSTLTLTLLVTAALFAGGCAGGPAPLDSGADGGSDAPTDARHAVCDAGFVPDPATCQDQPTHDYLFVLDQLTIDDNDSPLQPHTGFDLDGLFSGPVDPYGCNHQDYFSVDDTMNCPDVDGDGHCIRPAACGCAANTTGCTGGVDNQLPTLANDVDVLEGRNTREALRSAIAHGDLAVLVQVGGIENDCDDPDVTVSLMLAYPAFGTDCGSVMPDRAYSLARSSLAANGTGPDAALVQMRGEIRNGTLRITVPSTNPFPLPLDRVLNNPVPFPMQGLRLTARLQPDSLSNGNMGAYVAGSDLYAVTVAFPGANPDYVAGFVDGNVDLLADGICSEHVGRNYVFGNVGVGFGFHAVPARLSTDVPVADAPLANTCAATDAFACGSQTCYGGQVCVFASACPIPDTSGCPDGYHPDASGFCQGPQIRQCTDLVPGCDPGADGSHLCACAVAASNWSVLDCATGTGLHDATSTCM